MQESIKLLPEFAGVYQFFDEAGRLLYVGKAKNLKNRVRSYFKFTPEFGTANDVSIRIAKMINEARRLEWTIASCEADALVLENSLIKQLNPKYNILLRDDKTYPYITVDFADDYPRLEITRKTQGGTRQKYYGPFVGSAKELLSVIYEKYKLTQKKSCTKGKKACLFYQIDRCYAPCEFDIDKKLYAKELQNAIDSIFEKKPLLDFLEQKMATLACDERFEEAANARDAYIAIKNMEVQSQLDLAKDTNLDAICIVDDNNYGVVVRVFVRNGKVVSISHTAIKNFDKSDIENIYANAIIDFYHADLALNIKEIIVANELESKDGLEDFLLKRFGKKVAIHAPKIGEKKSLIEFATTNGFEFLRKNKNKTDVMAMLKNMLNLDLTPCRVETFDASHLGGKNPVAAMVTWDNDTFDKKSYKTYHVQGTDEYSQMREILTRRALDFSNNPPPDIWLIDGGGAQRKLAQNIIESAGAFVSVVAIAKEKRTGRTNRSKGGASDRILYKDQEFKLSIHDPKLLFLQRLRDESHRFVLNFQRKTRLKESKQIELMSECGIKIGHIQKLISALGSFEAIENASLETLCGIIEHKIGCKVINYYNSKK